MANRILTDPEIIDMETMHGLDVEIELGRILEEEHEHTKAAADLSSSSERIQQMKARLGIK